MPSTATADATLDMHLTCDYHNRMSTMIQIRNVPDDLHRKLKSRAALAGMSLSDYLLGIVARAAELPTDEEIRERLRSMPHFEPRESIAEAVRAERDQR
jgi:plasmid stability protein